MEAQNGAGGLVEEDFEALVTALPARLGRNGGGAAQGPNGEAEGCFVALGEKEGDQLAISALARALQRERQHAGAAAAARTRQHSSDACQQPKKPHQTPQTHPKTRTTAPTPSRPTTPW